MGSGISSGEDAKQSQRGSPRPLVPERSEPPGLGREPGRPHGGRLGTPGARGCARGPRPPLRSAPHPRATPRRHSLRREGTASRPRAAAPRPRSSSRRRRRQPARSRSRTAGIAPALRPPAAAPLRSAQPRARSRRPGPGEGRAPIPPRRRGRGGPGGRPAGSPREAAGGERGRSAGKCRSCSSGRLPTSKLWIHMDKILCNDLIFHLKTPTFFCLYPKYFYLKKNQKTHRDTGCGRPPSAHSALPGSLFCT